MYSCCGVNLWQGFSRVIGLKKFMIDLYIQHYYANRSGCEPRHPTDLHIGYFSQPVDFYYNNPSDYTRFSYWPYGAVELASVDITTWDYTEYGIGPSGRIYHGQLTWESETPVTSYGVWMRIFQTETREYDKINYYGDYELLKVLENDIQFQVIKKSVGSPVPGAYCEVTVKRFKGPTEEFPPCFTDGDGKTPRWSASWGNIFTLTITHSQGSGYFIVSITFTNIGTTVPLEIV